MHSRASEEEEELQMHQDGSPRELSRRRRWQCLQTTQVSIGARKLQAFTEVREDDSTTELVKTAETSKFGPMGR